jgi:hypothetical protein
MSRPATITAQNSQYAAKRERQRLERLADENCPLDHQPLEIYELGTCGGCGRTLYLVLNVSEVEAGHRHGAVPVRCGTCGYVRPRTVPENAVVEIDERPSDAASLNGGDT